MVELLLSQAGTPFTIALGIMVALVVLELASALISTQLSALLDSALPDFDIDADFDIEADADIHAGGGWVMDFFQLGRVPVLILIMLFMLLFGLGGLAVQIVAQGATGAYLPSGVAAIVSLLLSLPGLHYGAKTLARIIPGEETSAVSKQDLVGQPASIVLGTARRGSPAQAKARDIHGQTHYIMVEPIDDDAELNAGQPLRLEHLDGNRFLALPAPSDLNA